MASCPGTAARDRGRPARSFYLISWEERVLMNSGRNARGPRCGKSLHPDRRQVLEPVLRLDEALYLRRHGMWVGVVHHPHQHGIVDNRAVRLRHQLVLLLRIEGALGLIDDGIDLRVRIPAPVDADRRNLAGMEEADDGVERI